MPFVNEYIPKEDLEKYNFRELNLRPKPMGSTPARHWTVDRDASIWLRLFCRENDHTEWDGGFTGKTYWDFYWKGRLLSVVLKSLGSGGGRGEHCWGRKKLLRIDIPDELNSQRTKIINDLELALTTYADGGVFSSSTSYTFVLDV